MDNDMKDLLSVLMYDPGIYIFGSSVRFFVGTAYDGKEQVKDIDIIVTEEDILTMLIHHSDVFDEIPSGRVTKYKLEVAGIKLDVVFTEDPTITAEDVIYSSTFNFQHCYYHMGKFHYNKELYSSSNLIMEDIESRRAEMYKGELNFFNSSTGIMAQMMKLNQNGWDLNV